MAHPRIRILEYHIAMQLLVARDGPDAPPRCFGADVLDRESGRTRRIKARAVLLATGRRGAGLPAHDQSLHRHRRRCGPRHRAGASIANLEFMQFHPTSFYRPGSVPFLISEAVRGEGGVLRNEAGEAFMSRFDARADLAPRDIVARAIDHEMKKSGAPCVYLDVTSVRRADLEERFPNIYRHLLSDGVDMATEPVPVVPAAHYLCGGVLSDLDGRTNIPGLFVSGEVACTGMHGANRLASNSLLEAVVLSRRAAAALKADPPLGPSRDPDFPQLVPADPKPPGVLVAHLRRDARQIMWDYVGIVRTNLRLEWARRNLERLRGEADLLLLGGKRTYELVELDNILVTARLMVECAIRRKESRGLHNNTDYPESARVGHRHDPGTRREPCRPLRPY